MFVVDNLKLPKGATLVAEKPILYIVVDPDKAYPPLLNELGIKREDLDQFWAEVVFQCVKMDIQTAVIAAGGSFGFKINIMNRPAWKLSNLPLGRGPIAATKGREARTHFIRIRGTMPV